RAIRKARLRCGVRMASFLWVRLPLRFFKKHDVFGTVEAVKAVSELFSPVSGTVTAINDRLEKEPALVNNSPYGDGWMIQMKLTNAGEKSALLDAGKYGALLEK